MELISVLVGVILGVFATLTGIGLKILYIKLIPYLSLLSLVKEGKEDVEQEEQDDLYSTVLNEVAKLLSEAKKEEKNKEELKP
jgi:hypothetical protein